MIGRARVTGPSGEIKDVAWVAITHEDAAGSVQALSGAMIWAIVAGIGVVILVFGTEGAFAISEDAGRVAQAECSIGGGM